MTTQTDAAAAIDAAVAYLRDHDAEHLAQLDDFLAIESVSADPERNDDVRRRCTEGGDQGYGEKDVGKRHHGVDQAGHGRIGLPKEPGRQTEYDAEDRGEHDHGKPDG